MLIEIQHRNIVKLHGYCLHKHSMFLVFESMERGSLFCVLSNNVEDMERGSLFCVLTNNVEAVALDWIKMMEII